VPSCQRLHPSDGDGLTGDALGGPPSTRAPLSRAALAAHGPTIWQVAGGGAAEPSPLTGNTPTRQKGPLLRRRDPSPPFAAPSARRSPRGWPVRRSPRSPAQLQLESGWCGSTLPSHDFSVLSLGLGLPFLAATTGRVALPVVRRATGASPATNIRQGYACLFPSLPILLREIKHPNP
jgi:hypothetical protein